MTLAEIIEAIRSEGFGEGIDNFGNKTSRRFRRAHIPYYESFCFNESGILFFDQGQFMLHKRGIPMYLRAEYVMDTDWEFIDDEKTE